MQKVLYRFTVLTITAILFLYAYGICVGTSIIQDKLKDELPMAFVLPENLPADIEAGLQAQNLQRSQLASLVTIVAHAMYGHIRYPTKEERDSVARNVVTKYPFLRSPIDNTGYVSENT